MAVKLFCYRKGNSPLHRMPALVKILFMIVFCVTAFIGGQEETSEEILQKSVFFNLLYCICTDILLFLLAKASFKSVLQMKWVLWFGLMVTTFRLVPENTSFLGSWELYKPVLENGLLSGGLYTLRFFFASFACQMIFETTSSLEIRESFENVHIVLCRAFPFFKSFNFAFILSLSITFIPEVFETWDKVRTAVRARKGKSRKFSVFFRILLTELTAIISILITKSENRRKAILNRGYE